MRENIGKIMLAILAAMITVILIIVLVFENKRPTYDNYSRYSDGRDGAVISSYNINMVGLEWLPEDIDVDKMTLSCKNYLDSIGISEDVTVSIEDYIEGKFIMQEYTNMTYFYISAVTLEIIDWED